LGKSNSSNKKTPYIVTSDRSLNIYAKITMKQFEYKTLEFDPKGKWVKTIAMDSSELEIQLNTMGKNGWELIIRPIIHKPEALLKY
jgi:hypothetical protein